MGINIAFLFDGLRESRTFGKKQDLAATLLRGMGYYTPFVAQKGKDEGIERSGLIRSMSKKGCSPDNAACEGLFGRIKNEFFYNRLWAGVSIAKFMNDLDDYLHWHNNSRIKLSLEGMSPMEHRRYLGLAI